MMALLCPLWLSIQRRSPNRDIIFEQGMSDVPLDPPLRLSPVSSSPLPLPHAHAHLATFILEFKDRSHSVGGDTTIVAQLDKLQASLLQKVQGNGVNGNKK
jgi:hypothetical protein